MVTTAKNKNELIEGLKKEKDFAVLAVHTGPASTVAKEVAKLSMRYSRHVLETYRVPDLSIELRRREVGL